MKDIFRLDSESRRSRIIRSAIIFPVALIVILFCQVKYSQGLEFSFAFIGALIVLTGMITGFPYAWDIVKNMIRGSYVLDEVTGEYYQSGGMMGIALIYSVAITVGLVFGGILFVIDLLMFIVPIIFKNDRLNS